MKKEEKPKILLLETYVAVIRHSVGSKMFQEYWATYEKKRQNLVEDGNLSCAYFVSFLLKGFGLIDDIHITVNGTVRAMKKNGWKESQEDKAGAIIVWEPMQFEDGLHKHIGFSLGDGTAVSTSYKTHMVSQHPIDFGGKRKIEGKYWHSKLKKQT